jgi:hypothetical protein
MIKKILKLASGLAWDFWFPALILLEINLPLFDPVVWYDRDTAYVFHMFYGFYTDFFFHGELARWLPFGCYGIPADFFQFCQLAGMQYFGAALGWLLRIRDAHFLFKCSVVLEEFGLLFGTWLLSRQLFKNRVTVLFVCLGTIASTLWIPQINWNFRIYSMLPLIFYLILMFFRKGRPHYLWLAGSTLVLGQPGTPPYFVIFYSGLSLIFFLAAGHRFGFRPSRLLERSRANFLSFTLLAFLAAVYVFFVSHMLQGIITTAPGRAGNSLAVPIENFLKSSSDDITVLKFLGLFFARYAEQDTTLYIGILPLIFSVYGLLRSRRPLLAAFGWMTLFILCFSISDTTFIARTLYNFFPPIRLVRYIGNMNGLLRLFLMILAGYGVDQWLSDHAPQKKQRTKDRAGSGLAFLFSCGTVLGLMLVIKLLNTKGWLFQEQWPSFSWCAWSITLGSCFLLAYELSAKRVCSKNQRSEAGTAVTVALLVLTLDLLAYQTLFQLSWPRRLESSTPNAAEVYPFKYQRTRKLAYDLNEHVRSAAKIVAAIPFRLSVETYHFLLFDMGVPREFPNYYWLSPVYELIENRFPQFNHQSSLAAFLSTPGTDTFFNVFGIATPKLRLISNAVFAPDHATALNVILNPFFPIDRAVVLENVSNNVQKNWKSNPTLNRSGKITVDHFSFNQISLTADVQNPDGGWLYYTDAYHPGWHAQVDRKNVPVYPANIAFKAVFVPSGNHSVRFYFWNGMQSLAGLILAFAGILFALVLLILMGKTVLRPYA